MKKLVLLLIFGYISLNSFGQDPALFKTWALSRMEFHWAQPLQISEVEPPISPWLTISEDLEFNGFGACNSFSGSFINISTNQIEPINYIDTLIDCETNFLDAIEDEYFGYFNNGVTLYYNIFTGTDGMEYLQLSGIAPFDSLVFVASTLSVEDQETNRVTVYPNPSKERLFIASEQATIERITIYDISGHKIIQQRNIDNSIDVSPLALGLYLIEVTSQSGKAVERFVKK